jgi:predicted enzyme related to lactoylglutathione lyase
MGAPVEVRSLIDPGSVAAIITPDPSLPEDYAGAIGERILPRTNRIGGKRMTDAAKPQPGSIVWTDLTVENAEELRDFYGKVVGWKPASIDMGEYSDFSMNSPATGEPVAGVCHARGTNAGLPPHWLVYITVADLDQSISTCKDLGGEVIVGPKGMGSHGRYCVIRDPAGAVAALIEPTQ